MDNTKQANFIATLLHGVTSAHILHLKQKGPGSFARHMALGELYEELGGLVDQVDEDWQGLNGIIQTYPNNFKSPGQPLDYVSWLYNYVQNNRECMGKESHIQNNIDEVCSLLTRTMYKLSNLA